MSISNTFSGFEAYLGIAGIISFIGGCYFANYFSYVLVFSGLGFIFWMGLRLKKKSDSEDNLDVKLINLINIKESLDELRQKNLPATNNPKKIKQNKPMFSLLSDLNNISKEMGDLIKNGKKV